MKTNPVSLLILAACAAAAVLFVAGGQRVAASSFRVDPPTAASTATPGPAPTENGQPLPTLAGGPLLTPEQVLGQALEIDRNMSTWERPWSVDTWRSEPGRITLALFPSRTAESGGGETYGPGLDAAAGPVWRITIQGRVHVELLTMNVPDHNQIYAGVTYVIAQNSGALLKVSTGETQ
jgi:hypothetical protein